MKGANEPAIWPILFASTSPVPTTKQRLNEIYSVHTGQKVDKVDKDLDRDNFMSPQEALEYGLIDKIIEKKSK